MLRVRLNKKLLTAEGPINLEVDFKLEHGEFVTLFGDSGTGKTTILRMIAGLTEPDSGFVQVGDDVWFDSERRINWPVQKRHIGFVFQDYSLFPNMTVRENLEFALSNPKETHLIDELLDIVHLAEMAHRKPDTLSGGQKQRIALLRAIARKPKVFLLDEPLAALDVQLRSGLQDEILKIYKRFGTTTVFVSHDLSEVFKLSNRVFILSAGKIIKSGYPGEVFNEQKVSGKFKFTGEVIAIEPDGVIYIVTIRIGNNLTRVVATDTEIDGLKIGDKVIVAAKAFNPMILKYNLPTKDI